MKLSLPILLLIGDTSACGFNLDKNTWVPNSWVSTTPGGLSDLNVVKSCKKVGDTCKPNTSELKITNTSGQATQILIPIIKKYTFNPKFYECDIDLHIKSKNSSVGITKFGHGPATAILMPEYYYWPDVNNKSWVWAFSPHNEGKPYNTPDHAVWHEVSLDKSYDSDDQGNRDTGFARTWQEIYYDYKDLKVQLDIKYATVQIFQKSMQGTKSLLKFYAGTFQNYGMSSLTIQLEAKGEYAVIRNLANEGAIEVPQKKKDQSQTKDDDGWWTIKNVHSLTTLDDTSRNGPSSIVDLAETDFSVKNSALNNEFSVKNSTFDARDIVISVLVGLIAVLTSVAVYQYKGIETLKRVANGSDYQKM